jgi:hypothetical protein
MLRLRVGRGELLLILLVLMKASVLILLLRLLVLMKASVLILLLLLLAPTMTLLHRLALRQLALCLPAPILCSIDVHWHSATDQTTHLLCTAHIPRRAAHNVHAAHLLVDAVDLSGPA